MPHLTVAQNIFIGREPRRALGFLDDRKLNDNARRLLETLRLDLDPPHPGVNLTVATQQMVEIAKALSFNSEVLIMDEPTAALTETEIDDLFRIIRQLRDRGVGVVHISHRLEELKQISDRITVMRDGKYVGTRRNARGQHRPDHRMMVGRIIYETVREVPDKPSTEIALEARGLQRGRTIKNVSFQLRRGESWGSPGWSARAAPRWPGPSSARTRSRLARSSSGEEDSDPGPVRRGPSRHRLPVGRPQALWPGAWMDVETNLVLTAMRRFLRLLGWVDTSRTQENGDRFVSALRIRTPASTSGSATCRAATSRSGGRQVAHRRHPTCSSSTSPPAASTWAPRARSTGSSTTSPSRAIHHHDLLGAARAASHEPPHPGHVRGRITGEVGSGGLAGGDHAVRHPAQRRDPRGRHRPVV